ncbi:MAG: rhodanese-like domain-containing protein [Myxococcales bacterium]|nr:rhodanese-like domain-containing protein [Myxococcales bacterium]
MAMLNSSVDKILNLDSQGRASALTGRVPRSVGFAMCAAWLCLSLLSGCGTGSGGFADVGLGVDGDGSALTDESPDGGGNGGGDGVRAWPDGRYITCEQVYEFTQAKVPELLLLNVADEEFYNLGSIEGSLKIPWDELAGRLSDVDARRYVVIYCRRGVRSESAYDTLDGAGYAHKWIMEGGIERWNSLGYPTEP